MWCQSKNTTLFLTENKINRKISEKGCPPISFYTADNLDRGLESATVNFINSETIVDVPSKTVELSRLFLWYKLDFIEESVNHSNEDELLLK